MLVGNLVYLFCNTKSHVFFVFLGEEGYGTLSLYIKVLYLILVFVVEVVLHTFIE